MLNALLCRNFRAIHRLDAWFKVRYSQGGLLLLGLLVGAGIFAIDTRATVSYQLFGLAFALLAVAKLAAPFRVPRVSATRRLPRFATVGEPMRYAVVLRAENRRERGLSVLDRCVADPPGPADIITGRRLPIVTYHRWLATMHHRLGALTTEKALPDLPPGILVSVPLSLVPARRGRIRLGHLQILRPDPLGLFRARRWAGQRESVVVLPRRHPTAWPAGGRRREQGADGAASFALGGSDDFAGVRDYRPGDPMRHVYWKGWARHGNPVVKEFHDRALPRPAVILDPGLASDAPPELFEVAITAAASLICAHGRGAPAMAFLGRLCAPGRDGVDQPAEAHLEALALARPQPPGGLEDLAETVLRATAVLGPCVCVFTAWGVPQHGLVARLRAAGLALLVLVVVKGEASVLAPGPLVDRPDALRRLPAEDPGPELARLSDASLA